jgi:hypothetical protein
MPRIYGGMISRKKIEKIMVSASTFPALQEKNVKDF